MWKDFCPITSMWWLKSGQFQAGTQSSKKNSTTNVYYLLALKITKFAANIPCDDGIQYCANCITFPAKKVLLLHYCPSSILASIMRVCWLVGLQCSRKLLNVQKKGIEVVVRKELCCWCCCCCCCAPLLQHLMRSPNAIQQLGSFSRAWASRLSWLAKLTKDEKCSELGKL